MFFYFYPRYFVDEKSQLLKTKTQQLKWYM